MNETNYAGKLYRRLDGEYVYTGWHTDDVDKLTADVKRLETENRRIHNEYIEVSHDAAASMESMQAENQRLKCLFRFACEVLAHNDFELDADGHKLMIERLYDDTQAEAQ
jgi:cell shape-determining protein MreC